MLRGREAELAELAGAKTRAQAGVAQVALVYGVGGIGRTALLDAMYGQLAAAGTTIVRVSGDDAEASLTFGIVDQILHGLGHGPIGIADATAAGAILLAAWGAAARAAIALAVVIDDAQWADAPSMIAIAFALRRLNAAPAFTLIACAGELEDHVPAGIRRLADGDTGCTVALGPLAREPLAQLLRDAGLPHLTREQIERVGAHTDGNPLHVLTLVRELDAAEFESDIRGPFRAPRSIDALVQARVAALSSDAEALVVAAAVLGSKGSVAAVNALVGIADPARAVAEARAADLIVVEPGPGEPIFRFTHAMTRSAIYHGVAPDRIAALHRLAAELEDDHASALRHRMQGAPGPNEALAIEADGLADLLAHQGAWFEAAAWLDAAQRVSSTARSRERRVLTAELYRTYGGAPPTFAAFTDADLKTDHPLRALLAGGAAVADSRFAEGELHLRAAWDLVDPSREHDLAARIALRLSDALQGQLRIDEALEWATAALAVLPEGYDLLGEDPVTDLVFGLALAGHPDDAKAALDRHLPESATGGGGAQGLLGRGFVKLWADDLSGAYEDFTTCAGHFRRFGPPHRCVEAEFMLTEVHYRNGRWDTAVRHADEAVSLQRDLEIGQLLALALVYAASVPAARGEWTRAAALLDEATEILSMRGAYAAMGYTWLGRARLAAAKDDHQGVLDALSTVASLASSMPLFDEESIFPWRLPYAIALLGLGRVDDAAEHSDRLTASAERRGNPSTAASAARLRGAVAGARGNIDLAGAELAAAATMFNTIPIPFEAAVADFDHGVLLARHGRRVAATERLGLAHAAFAYLGAAPFVERCEAELARAAGLSRAEAAVADLVVSGKSNRDVAAALHLSVRTVEDHLGHIYTKLGVSSRTQLAALLSRDPR